MQVVALSVLLPPPPPPEETRLNTSAALDITHNTSNAAQSNGEPSYQIPMSYCARKWFNELAERGRPIVDTNRPWSWFAERAHVLDIQTVGEICAFTAVSLASQDVFDIKPGTANRFITWAQQDIGK